MALLLLCANRVVCAQATHLQPFTIIDQLDVEHTDVEFRDQVTVFLGGDRKGTAYTREWWEALVPAVAGEARTQMVQFAHLKGVPSFIRGKVKNSFPKDPSAWVLLDWKGFFARTYGFQKKSLNIYVFDDLGRLVLQRAVQELDADEFEEIVAVISAAAGSGD
jgi:hypothetical protein